MYLALQWVLAYQVAYALAYVTGIALSYWINTRFVFRVQGSRRKQMTFPLVYIVQYAVSAALLHVLVEFAGISSRWAPLVVLVAVVPLTFLATRSVLRGR